MLKKYDILDVVYSLNDNSLDFSISTRWRRISNDVDKILIDNNIITKGQWMVLIQHNNDLSLGVYSSERDEKNGLLCNYKFRIDPDEYKNYKRTQLIDKMLC